MKKPRLLVIDGSNVCHRSYHALSGTDMRNAEGEALWAMHGMLGLIGGLIRDTAATHVVVCRDLPGGSPERKAMIPEYKAHRTAPEPDLRHQLDAYPQLFSELGMANIALQGWEADDLLASCARFGLENDWDVVIVTSDRDAYQLIEKGVTVVRPEGVIVTEQVVEKKYGVAPRLYHRLAALVGEPGDGIKGIDRVGVKTAAKLLSHWDEKLDDVIEDVEMLKAAGVSQKLAEGIAASAHIYRRNLDVARLRDDLPVADVLSKSALAEWDADHIQTVCRNWGLPRGGANLWAGVGETAPF